MYRGNAPGASGSPPNSWARSRRSCHRPLRASDDNGRESRQTRLQARISRAIEFVGVAIAVIVPLALLIVAVETRSPVAGGAGLFLGGIAALLIANR
ncbi:MAG: hypothetical protein ACI9TI_001313 [Natronomonas sp.]|jgi:hypothetical protein|uniref:hypothetical protein n=1 Tax=Natronomonas sp. TaxID=2184060 RepID=UPI003989008C